jgi:hypothetical protein
VQRETRLGLGFVFGIEQPLCFSRISGAQACLGAGLPVFEK